MIRALNESQTDVFLTNLNLQLAHTTNQEIFVFVHGFNVTFDDSVMRTAQLAHDLRLDGIPVTYSWPSQGSESPLGYTRDEQAAETTVPHLQWFLTTLATRTNARTIYLLAHSMGSRVLTGALKGIVVDGGVPHPKDIFKETILAAPDIDRNVFIDQIAPALERATKRVTLYASANDHALNASKTIHGYRRAGDTVEEIVIIRGVDTIDATAVDTSFIGHSYYGDERSVISDIFSIVSNGLSPAHRFGMTGMPKNNPKYWVFNP